MSCLGINVQKFLQVIPGNGRAYDIKDDSSSPVKYTGRRSPRDLVQFWPKMFSLNAKLQWSGGAFLGCICDEQILVIESQYLLYFLGNKTHVT